MQTMFFFHILCRRNTNDRHKIEKRFIFVFKRAEQKKNAKIKRLEAIMVCNRILFSPVRILAMGPVHFFFLCYFYPLFV